MCAAKKQDASAGLRVLNEVQETASRDPPNSSAELHLRSGTQQKSLRKGLYQQGPAKIQGKASSLSRNLSHPEHESASSFFRNPPKALVSLHNNLLSGRHKIFAVLPPQNFTTSPTFFATKRQPTPPSQPWSAPATTPPHTRAPMPFTPPRPTHPCPPQDPAPRSPPRTRAPSPSEAISKSAEGPNVLCLVPTSVARRRWALVTEVPKIKNVSA